MTSTYDIVDPIDYRPMLAKELAATHLAKILTLPSWVMMPKLDGHRLMIVCNGASVTGVGRNGVKAVPSRIHGWFVSLNAQAVFDGELIKQDYHVFDLVEAGTAITPDTPFYRRREALEHIISKLQLPSFIHLVPTWCSEDDKLAHIKEIQKAGGEGVMFHYWYANYDIDGRRVDELRKHKFVHTVDAEVLEKGIDGKDNALLGVYRLDGTLMEIGHVSLLWKGDVNVGDVIEVKYLYCVSLEAPRLVQPRMLRVRTDKKPGECLATQLHWTTK